MDFLQAVAESIRLSYVASIFVVFMFLLSIFILVLSTCDDP